MNAAGDRTGEVRLVAVASYRRLDGACRDGPEEQGGTIRRYVLRRRERAADGRLCRLVERASGS